MNSRSNATAGLPFGTPWLFEVRGDGGGRAARGDSYHLLVVTFSDGKVVKKYGEFYVD